MKHTRRQFLQLSALAAAGVVLAACTPTAVPGTAVPKAGAATAVKVLKTMTILHWAQSAEPTDPSAQLEAGAVRKVAFQEIADEYKAGHPNVTINWYRFPAGSTTQEWLLARMAAEDCPDIFWSNADDLWPHINKGWALDFTEYMNMPNPYVAGNKAWKDQFEDVAIFAQTGPDGKMYGVNMDGAGVLTVYNKKAFKEAGIEKEPKTWGEFMDAWKKLLAKGYIPYGADLSTKTCCFPHWFEGHTMCQLLWDDIFKWDDDKNKIVDSKELAKHYQLGDWPDWEAFKFMGTLMKSMVPYFPKGFEGEIDYRQLFRRGECAMYMEGNWQISAFKASPLDFDFGWISFPVITKDMWPKSQEKVLRIQGAWGAMQYHVPGYLAKKDPDKVTSIMDWLMFVSKPENVTRVLMETSLVPLTKGAKGIPELEPFTRPYDRAVPYQSWNSLSGGALTAEYGVWQKYLPTAMTDDELIVTAKATLAEEVKKVLESNPEWKI